MILLRDARQLVIIVQLQPTPIQQSFLLVSLQCLQLWNSSFCDIGNLILSEPMHSELPRVFDKITVIHHY
jgi:hypothetical protein